MEKPMDIIEKEMVEEIEKAVVDGKYENY